MMKKLLAMLLCLALCGCSAPNAEPLARAAEPAGPMAADVLPTLEPTAEPLPTPKPTAEPQPITITVRAVGDIMLHEAQQISALTGDGSYDFSEYFTAVAEELRCADLTIGNLETPVTGDSPEGYPRFDAPPELLDELKQAGFDCFTLANNHILDQDPAGVSATIANVEAAGFSCFGASRKSDGQKALVVDVQGVKLGLVAHTFGTNGHEDAEHQVSYLEKDAIAADIAWCKEQGADLVIAFPHWGIEYYEGIDDSTARWAQALADCGADVILGSHPHVLEPFEQITANDGRTVPVLHSMGNFISNQQDTPRFLGMIVELTITKQPDGSATLDSMGYLPTFVYKYSGKAKYCYEVLPLRLAQTDERMDASAKRKVRQADEYLTNIYDQVYFSEIMSIASYKR